jgi:lipoate-protein ligase B
MSIVARSHKGTLAPPVAVAAPACRACTAHWLGRIGYEAAWAMQKSIWQQKLDGRPDDVLLLLEHPPTITLGKSGKMVHLLVTQEELAQKGVSLFFSDRGGDITYHGPGQLVAYPIIDLTRHGKDVHRYIYSLQEVVIRTLADYSIEGRRDDRYVGVWVAEAKIAAIGVAIHRWITMHGLALNVNPNMQHFSLITPCGISDRPVTSLAAALGRPVAVQDVVGHLARHFAEVFGLQVTMAEPSSKGGE